jgi:hypothetical protein
MLSNYKLAEIGIPLEEKLKFSEDKARVNKYGHKLVELCKHCSLYIANDRVYKDKFIGRSTLFSLWSTCVKSSVLFKFHPASVLFLFTLSCVLDLLCEKYKEKCI